MEPGQQRTIVIATGGSDHATAAVMIGLSAAKAMGAAVQFVHAA